MASTASNPLDKRKSELWDRPREEAENLALEMLKRDEGDYLHCGEWTETEIEELDEVTP